MCIEVYTKICMEAEAILKMDIFFFVTTLVVILIGVLLVPALYYFVQIVRNVRDVTAAVKEETDATIKDFREIRKGVKEGVATARRYTSAAAGAGLLKTIGSTIERFVQQRMAGSGASTKEKPRAKRSAKKRTKTTEN